MLGKDLPLRTQTAHHADPSDTPPGPPPCRGRAGGECATADWTEERASRGAGDKPKTLPPISIWVFLELNQVSRPAQCGTPRIERKLQPREQMASYRPILDRVRAGHAFLDDDIVNRRPNNRFSELKS